MKTETSTNADDRSLMLLWGLSCSGVAGLTLGFALTKAACSQEIRELTQARAQAVVAAQAGVTAVNAALPIVTGAILEQDSRTVSQMMPNLNQCLPANWSLPAAIDAHGSEFFEARQEALREWAGIKDKQ